VHRHDAYEVAKAGRSRVLVRVQRGACSRVCAASCAQLTVCSKLLAALVVGSSLPDPARALGMAHTRCTARCAVARTICRAPAHLIAACPIWQQPAPSGSRAYPTRLQPPWHASRRGMHAGGHPTQGHSVQGGITRRGAYRAGASTAASPACPTRACALSSALCSTGHMPVTHRVQGLAIHFVQPASLAHLSVPHACLHTLRLKAPHPPAQPRIPRAP